MTSLAHTLDATLLDATAGERQLLAFARHAKAAGCAAVCVYQAHLPVVLSAGLPVAVVVAFPHGADNSRAKAAQTRIAVENGAAEIDMVMRIDALLAGDERTVVADLAAVVNAAAGRPVKAIMETGVLTPAAFELACRAVVCAGAAFAKTSTGKGPRGASVQDVLRMRELLPSHVHIKASGGIRTRQFASELIAAGAARLGVSAVDSILAG